MEKLICNTFHLLGLKVLILFLIYKYVYCYLVVPYHRILFSFICKIIRCNIHCVHIGYKIVSETKVQITVKKIMVHSLTVRIWLQVEMNAKTCKERDFFFFFRMSSNKLPYQIWQLESARFIYEVWSKLSRLLLW